MKKYYVYIQGYKKNNKLYLYVGSHIHHEGEDFYDYRGSGRLLSDEGFEWVTKHIVQYYETETEMKLGETQWIQRFAKKFGVSGWVFRHYNDNLQCITDFVSKYHRHGGLLLNAKDTTDAPLQTKSSRDKAVATMRDTGYYDNLDFLFTTDVITRRNTTNTERYGDPMGQCHTEEAEAVRAATLLAKYDGDRMGQCHTKEAYEKSNINSHKTLAKQYNGDAY